MFSSTFFAHHTADNSGELNEARNSFFWPWSVFFEVKISHRR